MLLGKKKIENVIHGFLKVYAIKKIEITVILSFDALQKIQFL